MNPILRKVGGGWMLVTSVVAGVDTYRGAPCAGGLAPYFSTVGREEAVIANAAIAVPVGVINGVLNNFSLAVNADNSCRGGSYTHRFAGGLANLLHADGVRTAYLLNQGILGAGGAAIGGIVAEEVRVFSGMRARPE